MNLNPRIELISTGTELLNGKTVNRHAQVLGDALQPLGILLSRDTTVPDDAGLIRDAVDSALSRVEVVVISGGLGPTSDDLTRQIIGALAGCGLRMDGPSLEAIHRRFEKTGRTVHELTGRHALVLEGAAVLANSAGLAPGERIEHKGKTIFLLPGPPREFLAVLTEHVIPWLKEHFAGVEVPLEELFQVCGVGESDIVRRLEPLGFPAPGIEVAYCARPGQVEVRLKAAPKDAAALRKSSAIIVTELESAVFSRRREGLEDVAARLLTSRVKTLATAESCTGGLVAARVTSVAGASAFFKGGLVAYDNEIKIRLLEVDPEILKQHGAVSRETACAMATGIRKRMAADYGLSVTGIAGPGGGTEEKPVGLVYIGLASPGGDEAWECRFAGARESVRDWSVLMALNRLRLALVQR